MRATANLSECLKTECLIAQFETRCSSEVVAGSHDGHSEYKFGNCVGVLSRGVLDNRTGGSGSGKIDIVVAGTGAYDDL